MSRDSRLRALLLDMDIPKKRLEKMDLRWILLNIEARNPDHPSLKEVLQLTRKMLKPKGK